MGEKHKHPHHPPSDVTSDATSRPKPVVSQSGCQERPLARVWWKLLAVALLCAFCNSLKVCQPPSAVSLLKVSLILCGRRCMHKTTTIKVNVIQKTSDHKCTLLQNTFTDDMGEIIWFLFYPKTLQRESEGLDTSYSTAYTISELRLPAIVQRHNTLFKCINYGHVPQRSVVTDNKTTLAPVNTDWLDDEW